MSTICGRYVRTFAEASTGLLQDVSLNAPYPFFWVELIRIDGTEIVCTGAGEEMRLPFRRKGQFELARITIQDPFFGPLERDVAPFLREDKAPIGAQQGALL